MTGHTEGAESHLEGVAPHGSGGVVVTRLDELHGLLKSKLDNARAFALEADRRGVDGRFMNRTTVYWDGQADAFVSALALLTTCEPDTEGVEPWVEAETAAGNTLGGGTP